MTGRYDDVAASLKSRSELDGTLTCVGMLRVWAEHGLPYDRATCANAATIAQEALRLLDSQETIIGVQQDIINTLYAAAQDQQPVDPAQVLATLIAPVTL